MIASICKNSKTFSIEGMRKYVIKNFTMLSFVHASLLFNLLFAFRGYTFGPVCSLQKEQQTMIPIKWLRRLSINPGM